MLAVTTAAFLKPKKLVKVGVSSDQYTLRYHLVRGAKIRFTQINKNTWYVDPQQDDSL